MGVVLVMLVCSVCGAQFGIDAAGRTVEEAAAALSWTTCPECGSPVDLPDPKYTIINLTPHAVTVLREGAEPIEYPPSGKVARCATQRQVIGSLNGIPINRTKFGEVSGVPEPAPGVYYIVSAMVAQALPQRNDLLIPDDTVRDKEGRIIGCRAFARVR